MSQETPLRRYFGKGMRNRGAAVSQVESGATASGFPDTDLTIKGRDVRLELKCTYNGKAFKVRQSQWSWFRDRLKAGAQNLYFLCRHIDQGETLHYLIWVDSLDMLKILRSSTKPHHWGGLATQVHNKSIDFDLMTQEFMK